MPKIWLCVNCKTKNSRDHLYCLSCNKFKIQGDLKKAWYYGFISLGGFITVMVMMFLDVQGSFTWNIQKTISLCAAIISIFTMTKCHILNKKWKDDYLIDGVES